MDDVILLDSDDCSGGCGTGAVSPMKGVAYAPRKKKDVDELSILSSSESARTSDVDWQEEGKPSGANGVDQVKSRGSIVNVDACIDLDSDNDDAKSSSSSSSSSSSGIPSPCGWKARKAADRPPSVIHTKSPRAPAAKESAELINKSKPAKKRGLTNNKKSVQKDDMSCTDMSTTSSISNRKMPASKTTEEEEGNRSKAKAETAKKQSKPKKRQWGRGKKKAAAAASKSTQSTADSTITCNDSTTSQTTKSATKKPGETANKHFHCYLLRSLDPNHPLKTYIGFTTHPQRRIRQHNGILKNGGARRTKRSGRPWTFVCVIHGFQDKITALQFEWAWQNVHKSKAFREAVGDDKLAAKMKRRYGPKARLEELRILLKECLPFCLYSLTVYFPEREYHDIFAGILRRGKNGNPYKKDEDESEAYEPLLDIEVCPLDAMPVAREARELKEKKKAEREAKKAAKQHQKKKRNGAGADYSSDVSDLLDSAKSMVEEESWFDVLDEDEESKCSNLKTIDENDSSVDLCDISIDDEENSEATKQMQLNNKDRDVDDVSKDFFSLSMNGSRKHKHATMYQRAKEQDDFSTISSAESDCCLDGDDEPSANAKMPTKRGEKENHQGNRQSSKNTTSYASSNEKSRSSNSKSNCEVVDLCDSD